jgi:hypothetical protein
MITSLRDLPPRERWFLGALALIPGPNIDRYGAAALVAGEPAGAGRLLGRLVDRHLVEPQLPDRFSFHDLVASVARAALVPELAPDDRASALRRTVDYHLVVAQQADSWLTPHRHRVALDTVIAPVHTPELRGYDDARAWLAAEEDNLVATCLAAGDAGFDGPCWQLAYILRGWFFLTKRFAPWLATHRAALAASRRLGDRRAEALTLDNLGRAAVEQCELTIASRHFEQAQELFDAIGDEHGSYTTAANRAWMHFYEGERRHHPARHRASRDRAGPVDRRSRTPARGGGVLL